MPRKYKRRRKRRNKNTEWYNKKYSALEMAGKALSTANYIRKLINVEFKSLSIYDASGGVSTSGDVTSISTIPQGDGSHSRDGSSVKLQSLSIHGRVRVNSSATNSLVRMMVVQSVNDEPITIASLLEDVDNVLSMRNLDKTKDLRILADRTFMLDNVANPQKIFTLNIDNFPSQHIQYDLADTAGTSYKEGQIAVVYLSTETTNVPTTFTYSRIRYTDN